MVILKQIAKNNKQGLWIICGAVLMLLVVAPILLIPIEYHFGKHRLTLKEVMLNFYADSVNLDFVSAFVIILFLSIGGVLGYLLFRIKTSNVSTNKDATIEDLLLKGEGATIEFKASFRWDYRLLKTSKEIELASLKTIAAFMNSLGGTLLLGVADDSRIAGLDKDYESLKKGGRDGFEQYIMQAVALSLGAENCKNIQVSFVVRNNQDVCVISVKKTKAPAFLKHQQSIHFFVRAGNGTRELNIEEALKYIKGFS